MCSRDRDAGVETDQPAHFQIPAPNNARHCAVKWPISQTVRAHDRAFVDDEPLLSLSQINDPLSPSIIFNESDWSVGGASTLGTTDQKIKGPKHDNDHHNRRIGYRVGILAVRWNARTG